MAIVSKGTKISLTPSNKLPDGFTAPSVTAFSNWDYQMKRRTLQIEKDDVHNADEATTLLNIIQDATHGIEKLTSDRLATDFGGSNPNTVEFWVNLLGLTMNVIPADKTSEFYKNTTVVYQADVIVYVRIVLP